MCKSIAIGVLFIINLLVFLLGIAITVFGAIAQWGTTMFTESIVPFIAKALSASGAGDKASLTFTQIAAIFGQYLNYLGAAGLVIFIFGLVLILISLCGMCGAVKKSKCLLVGYIIFIGILLLGMVAITLVVRFARGDLTTKGREVLTTYITKTFVGISAGVNAQSAILSVIQARLECCGVDNSTIFSSAANWNRNYTYNGTAVTLAIPVTCCKMETGTFTPKNATCLTSPNAQNSNMKVGCFAKLMTMVDKYSWFVIYGLIGLDVFLLLLIICAVVIIRSVSQNDLKDV